MPIKSRMIEEKFKELSDRKGQFENELKTAALDLETLQKQVIKGTASTDSLVTVQIKVNTIEQTIRAFDLQLHTLETDLISQNALEKRKEIFSKIKALDDEAERNGFRFSELYTNPEQLKLGNFSEMGRIAANIEKLKFEFAQHLAALIPNLQQLKRRVLPELENELKNLIAELQSNHCKLSVLRATGLSLQRKYVTDDDYAFRLPKIAAEDWIWLSIRVAKELEQERQSSYDDSEKTGMFQRILDKIS